MFKHAKPDLPADQEQILANACIAAEKMLELSQTDVDKILTAMHDSMQGLIKELAFATVMETHKGILSDKETKIRLVLDNVYKSIKDKKTVGVIKSENMVEEIAEPLGVLFALTPITNPSTTVMFKAFLAIKTRNVVIFSFHPKSFKICAEICNILQKKAKEFGAPDNFIQFLPITKVDAINTFMQDPRISTIIATGGKAMVHAAYSSGNPAIGVGPGNCPCYVHQSCDLTKAIGDIVASKNFDNGMICASEQSIIIDEEIYDRALKIFVEHKAHICSNEEAAKIAQCMFVDGALNFELIGSSPFVVAETAGFNVAQDTKVLLIETDQVGEHYPLSGEKLTPMLTIYKAKSVPAAISLAKTIIALNGLGHSAAIHCADQAVIDKYKFAMPASRIMINQPSAFGAAGGICNNLTPSFTLGCGSYGGNNTTDNVTVYNLLNIKRVAYFVDNKPVE